MYEWGLEAMEGDNRKVEWQMSSIDKYFIYEWIEDIICMIQSK